MVYFLIRTRIHAVIVRYNAIWATAINSGGIGSCSPTDDTTRHPELIRPSIDTTDTDLVRIHIAENTTINNQPNITPIGIPSH